jgi:hypothetical protein
MDLVLDVKRQMLRHTLATLAYCAANALSNAPEEFGSLRIGKTFRTAGETLAHISDLLERARDLARGNKAVEHEPDRLPWLKGVHFDSQTWEIKLRAITTLAA